jgi:FAD/FMN-containing dehydrogenase
LTRAGQTASTKNRSRKRSIPVDFPNFALNGMTVTMFNEIYYRMQDEGERFVDLESYFYPLDGVRNWNRIYGARGFLQYQCVVPEQAGRAGIRKLLGLISEARNGSFLSVLKKLGRENGGYLSFPRPGYTLALDFPAKAATFDLLRRLDEVVVECGGRVYLAKDARMPSAAFAAGYPRLDLFRAVRRKYGLDARFRSLQSERLSL